MGEIKTGDLVMCLSGFNTKDLDKNFTFEENKQCGGSGYKVGKVFIVKESSSCEGSSLPLPFSKLKIL